MTEPAEDPAPEAPARPSEPAETRPFQLRGTAPRVMRLSRKALATAGVVAGLAIGGSLIYALSPATRKPAKELYNTESRSAAETITSGPKDYSAVPKLGAPLPGDLGRPILSAQQRGEQVPVPAMGQPAPGPDPAEQAAAAARQREAQERDAARTASLFLGGSRGAESDAEARSAAPAPAPAGEPAQRAPERNSRRALLERQAGATVSPARLTAPASPNILQAGSIIPAALITGIRSDLPGQITAQVTANVYDSPTGRILLVPQGARLIGEYDSDVSYGQNRVLLAWDRLILPDGRSITLDRQPGADAAGMSGLQDGVNYHWGNMLKAAFVSTLLGIGAELGADDDDDLVRALRRGGQDTITQTGQQIVRRQLNVNPTLTIRPGHPLRVIVTRDLVMEPLAQGNRK